MSPNTNLANTLGIASALSLLANDSDAAISAFTPSPSPYLDGIDNYLQMNDNYVGNSAPASGPTFYFCGGYFSGSAGLFLGGNDYVSGSAFEMRMMDRVDILSDGDIFTESDLKSDTSLIAINPASALEDVPFYVAYGFRAAGTTDQFQLGWAQLAVHSDPSGGTAPDPDTISVLNWAFESTPGQNITIGAVPEPSPYILLSIAGTVGFCLRKKRTP